MPQAPPTIDQLYALVANEEDARVCTDISEEACRVVPGNFFLILFSHVLTKLGDLLFSPKTVLTWLLAAVGAPAMLIAWLVPVRESGSMIPQLAIGAWVRRHPLRSGFWVAGSIMQGLCVAGMAAAVWWLDGLAAGVAVLALLVLFSLSRGFCSVAMKDVVGKCVPKARRGRLNGLSTSLAGLAVIGVGIWLFGSGEEPSRRVYMVLLLAGAVLWLLAAGLFTRVRETPGEVAGGASAWRVALANLRLLGEDAPFRKFVLTRALLLGSALASPFFLLLARQGPADGRLLAAFLLASSLASSLSAVIWGWHADLSSRRVLIRGGGLAAVVCLAAGLGKVLWPGPFTWPWLLPLLYFVLNIAYAGVRIGRKTYLLDMAGGVKRTDYVAVSNTVIGLLLLATGGVSALASLISLEAVLILLGVLTLLGTLFALRLQEV